MSQLESKGKKLIILGCIMFIAVPIIIFIMYHKLTCFNKIAFLCLNLLLSIIGFVIFMYGLAYKNNRTKLNTGEIIGAIFGGIAAFFALLLICGIIRFVFM
jgi:hypothetical protein